MNFISEDKINNYIGGNKNSILSNSKIIGENRFSNVMNLEIEIDPEILGPNFRYELIKKYKEKYEFKVYYLFYITKLNTEPLEKKKLPLIPENMIMRNNLEVEFYTIQKGSIIELSIMIIKKDGSLNLKAQNEYINCNIILSSEYAIKFKDNDNYEIIIKKTGNILKKDDKCFIRITNIHSSNDCQSDYIICEGEFVTN